MRISTSFAARSGGTCAIEQLIIEPGPPRISCMHMVGELFKAGVYFVQPEPDDKCEYNSRMGRIRGNTVLYSWKIWRGIKFGGLACDRHIKICQYFILAYIHMGDPLPNHQI